MSLVTRCTSCGTLFKVVADQLKISEGWVRCGQCATVFDAQAHLVQITEQAPQPLQSRAAQTSAEAAIKAPAVADPTDAPSQASAHDRQALEAQPPLQPEGDIASELQAFRESKWVGSGMLGLYAGSQTQAAAQNAALPVEQSDAPTETPTATPIDALAGSSFGPQQKQEASDLTDEPSSSMLRSDDSTSEPPVSSPPDVVLLETEPAQQIAGPAVDQDESIAAPGFVMQAKRAQRWRSPWVRLGLGLIGLALLAVLALQIALYEKDRIAAQSPQTKPWLDQLCQLSGCKVQALRHIEAMTVDASSFNRLNKNNAQLEATTQSYRLAVTLKNVSATPVALPHVELSLQDAQDQTVLRRVLSPADLGSSLSALAPSQEMPGNVTLQIDVAQLAGSRIAGYRVLAFYP